MSVLIAAALVLLAWPRGAAAADQCTKALVSDRSADAVMGVDLTTGAVSVVSQGGALRYVSDIAPAPAGRVYAYSMLERSVAEVDPATGVQTLLASGTLPLDGPGDIAVGGDGTVYAVAAHSDRIISIDPATGTQAEFARDGLLYATSDVVVESDGDLLLAQPQRIVRVDASTRRPTVIPVTSVEFDVRALELGADGEVYAGTSQGRLYRVDVESGAAVELPSPAGAPKPSFIADLVALGGDRLLASTASPSGLWRMSTVGQAPEPIATNPSLTFPESAVIHCDAGPTLEESPDLTAETDPGASYATVEYTLPTATDPTHHGVEVSCAPEPGSRFPIGTTAVTCTATDADGNTDSDTFDVTVVDREPPSLALPADVTVRADTGTTTAAVHWDALGEDNSGAAPTVVCDPASGTAFAIGTTTVSCKATDAAGNTATGSFTVTVTEAAPANPTTKEECRDRPGYQVFPGFKNRGDCVSYVATGGRNGAG